MLFSFAVGLQISYTGRYKPVCLYFGILLTILGVGLVISFPRPDGNIGYVVMCQILISFAAGPVISCNEIAIMAAASHQNIAVVFAVLGMSTNISGVIDMTTAATFWQGVLSKKLAEYLPASGLSNLPIIYVGITV